MKTTECELGESVDQQQTTAPADAERAYRSAVFAAGKMEKTELSDIGDPLILERAIRLPSDFQTDVATYRKRLRALAELATVPELERRAAELAGVASDDGGGRAVGDFSTVAELAQALAFYHDAHTPGYLSPEKEAAHEAKMTVMQTRAGARETLGPTTDPALAEEANAHRLEIARISRRIAGRARWSTSRAGSTSKLSWSKRLRLGVGPVGW